MRARFHILPLFLAGLLVACSKSPADQPKSTGPGNVSPVGFSGLTAIDNVSGTSLRLRWTPSDAAVAYQILDLSSGSPKWIGAVQAPASSYVVNGLAPATTYRFRVQLIDGSGLVDANTNDLVASTNAVTATFAGWTRVQAIGANAPAPQAKDLSPAPASISLGWNAVAVDSGALDSYNVYRSSTPGAEDYTAPLATGLKSPTFTDTHLDGSSVYYYTIAPVVAGSVVLPSAAADSEISVPVPAANMVLLHRWAANLESCGQLGRPVDRANDYRCTVATGTAAPPGTGNSGFLDLGGNLLVDAYEQGCNYSAATGKCGAAAGCIGTLGDPSGLVSGAPGDVYYSRQSGQCFLNTSAAGGTAWVAANRATPAQRQLMGAATPGLPPFVNLSQVDSQDVCSGQGAAGMAGVKRILRRREQFLVAAWDSALTDASISALENGSSLDSTHQCNSNYASPQGNSSNDLSGSNPALAFDNLPLPGAPDTLPACRHGDCASSAPTIRSLRTGSLATSSCVSRYGAQDLVGNVWEWASDQLSCDGARCTGIPGSSNSADSGNNDFLGVAFDGQQGPAGTFPFSAAPSVQLPLGLPIATSSFVGDAVVPLPPEQLHGDYLFLDPSPSTRALASGGDWSDGAEGGRYSLHAYFTPSDSSPYVGFRCALPAVPAN
jgi:Fibronectin type III domain